MFVAGAMALGPANGQSDPSNDDRPILGASMLNRGAESYGKTPLFKKISTAVRAARLGNTDEFFALLAPKAAAELSHDEGERKVVPLSPQILQSIASNCRGPFPIGERPSWIQFSFICNPDAKTSLATCIHFVNTPELTMTAGFKNGRMLWLDAFEVPVVPGRRYVAMDAYQHATDRK
ncbi:hypothetical protein ACFQ15_18385 [Sphingomonas hankookensis]|uniref:hypothetical protein n=1 Tax=Sphingomonas hankookensis TaxID=563996 RepID=UPI001F581BCA|nr:hypothetical protein [Sphingomonas hankookensis]